MTPLDPKGLRAAREAMEEYGKNFPGVMRAAFAEVGQRYLDAYLSASTTPSGEVEGLEVVAWRSKVDLADEWDFTAIDPHCDTTDFAAVEPLVRLSEASTALASMKREVERLDAECQASMATIADERRRAEAAEQRLKDTRKTLYKLAERLEDEGVILGMDIELLREARAALSSEQEGRE